MEEELTATLTPTLQATAEATATQAASTIDQAVGAIFSSGASDLGQVSDDIFGQIGQALGLNEATPEILFLNVLLLIVVMLIIYVLRRAFAWLILRPAQGLVSRTVTTLDDQVLEVLQQPLQLLIVSIGFIIAVNILDFGPVIRNLGERIALSFVVAAAIIAAYHIIAIIVSNHDTMLQVTRIKVDDRLVPFIRVTLKIFAVVIGVLVVIQIWGLDAGGLIASLGIIGLAFSLAAQNTAENIFGFAAIVSDNPFEVGDFIITPDVTGTVEKVGIRSTRIRLLDQSLAAVPNNTLTNASIVNWSRLSMRRMDFVIGVTYRTKSAQMRELLKSIEEMLMEHPNVKSDSVVVRFIEFGESSLRIRIICNIFHRSWNDFVGEQELILLKIMEVVESMGLSFAFPSQSLYLEQVPSSGFNGDLPNTATIDETTMDNPE